MMSQHGRAVLRRDRRAHVRAEPRVRLVSMLDGRDRARITDFGLAGVAEAVRGKEVQWGTPAYMATEQLAGGPSSGGLGELLPGRIPCDVVEVQGNGERDRLQRASHVGFALQLQRHGLLPAQLQDPASEVATVSAERGGGLERRTFDLRNGGANVVLSRGKLRARRLCVDVLDSRLEPGLGLSFQRCVDQGSQEPELQGDDLPDRPPT